MRLGNETTASFYVGRNTRIDVVGCWDEETPEGKYEFYDLFLHEGNDLFGEHLNTGSPWYGDHPTYEEVMDMWNEVWREQ